MNDLDYLYAKLGNLCFTTGSRIDRYTNMTYGSREVLINLLSREPTVMQDYFTSYYGNVGTDTNVHYHAYRGGGTAEPYVSNGIIRIYQAFVNEGETIGGNIKFYVDEGYITSIKIGTAMSTTINYTLGDSDEFAGFDYDFSANTFYSLTGLNTESITFHCLGKTKNTRLYINYVEITYVAPMGGDNIEEIVSGDTYPPLGTELCIKVKAQSKPSTPIEGTYVDPLDGKTVNLYGSILYPTVVKIGINLEENLITPEVFDDNFFKKFEWFNMLPCDNEIYGIYLNETIGHMLKYGQRNTVNCIFRIFDNTGKPVSVSPSVYKVYPYRLNLSGGYYPTSLDSAYEGFNQYVLPTKKGTLFNIGTRTLMFTVGRNSVELRETTPLSDYEQLVYRLTGNEWTHQRGEAIHISQYENIVLEVRLDTYYTDTYDGITVKGVFTDPKNISHPFYFRASTLNTLYEFNLNDLLGNDFQIGEDNDVSYLTLEIVPTKDGIVQPSIDLSRYKKEIHYFSTPVMKWDVEDLKQLFTYTALY